MKYFFINDFLKPTLTRVGAMVAGYLIATIGTDPAIANQVATGVTAVALVLTDLVTRRFIEKEGA